MSKLTSGNVSRIFMDCLFKEGEDHSKYVKGEGITQTFGFHPIRIESHKVAIREMLECLPDEFQHDKGGGMSFLNACMTQDGIHWGEHRSMEQLFALGIATGQAVMLMPREMWSVLPGGMPYFGVTAPESNPAEMPKTP